MWLSWFPWKFIVSRLAINQGHRVVTHSVLSGMEIVSKSEVTLENSSPVCIMSITARTEKRYWVVVSLRPYNPEGVSLVNYLSSGIQAMMLCPREIYPFLEDMPAWTQDRVA